MSEMCFILILHLFDLWKPYKCRKVLTLLQISYIWRGTEIKLVGSLTFVFVTNLENVDLEKLSFLFILLNAWQVLIYLFWSKFIPQSRSFLDVFSLDSNTNLWPSLSQNISETKMSLNIVLCFIHWRSTKLIL